MKEEYTGSHNVEQFQRERCTKKKTMSVDYFQHQEKITEHVFFNREFVRKFKMDMQKIISQYNFSY